jgi:hypothetical protein
MGSAGDYSESPRTRNDHRKLFYKFSEAYWKTVMVSIEELVRGHDFARFGSLADRERKQHYLHRPL